MPAEVLNSVLPLFTPMQAQPKQMLLQQGQVCRHLWFMPKGAVRYYLITDAGREVNTWFSIDGDIICDTPSFVQQVPSSTNIQVLETCDLYVISHAQLQTLLQNNHRFCLWYIQVVEKLYVLQMEDRMGDLQFLSATQRYEKLLQRCPDITNRICLGHVASYLNITQETLSRIRACKV